MGNQKSESTELFVSIEHTLVSIRDPQAFTSKKHSLGSLDNE